MTETGTALAIPEGSALEAMFRAKREADAAHRAKITADIVEALGAMAGRATPALIAEALIEGRIPHCRVVM